MIEVKQVAGALAKGALAALAMTAWASMAKADETQPAAEAPSAQTAASQPTAPATSEAVVLPLEERGYALGDIVMGDENAPVTIVEYASLTCPHCASFHRDAYPEIKANYIDTGKAKLVLREVYFDQFGLWASAVSRCGGDSRFYAFIDLYLNKQRDWSGKPTPAEIVEEIRRFGRLGGLSNERIDACLEDTEFHTKLIEDYQTNAQADGVRSTPYFLVNGTPVRGAVSAAEMAEAIDSALN